MPQKRGAPLMCGASPKLKRVGNAGGHSKCGRKGTPPKPKTPNVIR